MIGPETYVGPYTSIGDGCHVVGAEVEASILIGDNVVETPDKIVNSLIGLYATIRSSADHKPNGHRLVVGENCSLVL